MSLLLVKPWRNQREIPGWHIMTVPVKATSIKQDIVQAMPSFFTAYLGFRSGSIYPLAKVAWPLMFHYNTSPVAELKLRVVTHSPFDFGTLISE